MLREPLGALSVLYHVLDILQVGPLPLTGLLDRVPRGRDVHGVVGAVEALWRRFLSGSISMKKPEAIAAGGAVIRVIVGGISNIYQVYIIIYICCTFTQTLLHTEVAFDEIFDLMHS